MAGRQGPQEQHRQPLLPRHLQHCPSPHTDAQLTLSPLVRLQPPQVAAKSVRVAQASELFNFIREVEALALLRHPHVLPFLGAGVLRAQRGCLAACRKVAG